VFPASGANAAGPLAHRRRGGGLPAHGLVAFAAEVRLAPGRVIDRALVEGLLPLRRAPRGRDRRRPGRFPEGLEHGPRPYR